MFKLSLIVNSRSTGRVDPVALITIRDNGAKTLLVFGIHCCSKTALRDLELMLWRRRRHADVAVLINTHDFIKGLVILRYREHQFRFGIEFHIRCPHCIDGSSDLRVVLIGDLEQDS